MLLSFDGFIRLFAGTVVIAGGYGHQIVKLFMKPSIENVLQLLCLIGLSAIFSFVAFNDANMWSGSPDIVLALVMGIFVATVIFYMLYFSITVFSRAMIPE
ncbi:hypothetical protein [Enterobacter roggenkampii]|uniref:hypothetical protein n=1 Tax=Enterobacter roggenkampii TaxID=1812935 RepID=UPI001F06C68B|nr:hypothetical protein [Enterobacter roggenkampii]